MSFEDEDFKMGAVKSHDSCTVSRTEALKALGLTTAADQESVRSAFRQRLKSTHPDINGGTDALLRRLILARDLLMSDSKSGSEQADILQTFAMDAACDLSLSVTQAVKGGDIWHPQSQKHIPVPEGIRDGEQLKLSAQDGTDTLYRLMITPEVDCRIFGNDIWMSARIDVRILEQGGTAIIETPQGAQIVRIPAGVAQGSSLCLTGRGLPAVRHHAAGDLHIRLEAAPDRIRPATEVLTAFRQRWAG